MMRDNILVNLPRGRIVVLDCVVKYPAAASHIQGVSQLAGFVAAKAETDKRHAFELFGDGSGYEFLPLAGKSFGRVGKGTALPL